MWVGVRVRVLVSCSVWSAEAYLVCVNIEGRDGRGLGKQWKVREE